MLPVSIAFWHKMKAERYYFLWQKEKADEESKLQEPCRLTQGKTHMRRKTRIFTVIPQENYYRDFQHFNLLSISLNSLAIHA